MKKDNDIIKNIFKLEKKIKKSINNQETIPEKTVELLNEAKYTIDRLSEIVKAYKEIHE